MIKRVVASCLLLLSVSLFSVQLAALERGLPDFTRLIEKNSPAVVKIETLSNVSAQVQKMPPGVPEIFKHFFDQRSHPERKSRSMGSGFIVSEDGYILTNNHVVAQASEILVRLNDRDEYKATVIGSDVSTDLALLKIDGDDLPTIQFGDSEALKVGEWVVAIGSPFGLDYSASVGIVSAIGRSIPTDQGEDFVPFIQTDVAINPGNSGGPLFNLEGKVVGINSQIYTRSGGSNGISFSIPANLAQGVIAQLKEHGRVERGWFGITMQAMDKDLARSLGLDKNHGALVSAVQADGPADKAGIKAGDVIVKIGGRKVATINDLSHIVGLTKPGKTVNVKILRDGKRRELSVKVGLRDHGTGASVITGVDRLGLVTSELDKKLLAQWHLDGGVMVDSVGVDSAASRSGLQVGDVIVRLGMYQVSNHKEYAELVEKMPVGQPVTLRLYRQGRARFTTIVLEE